MQAARYKLHSKKIWQVPRWTATYCTAHSTRRTLHGHAQGKCFTVSGVWLHFILRTARQGLIKSTLTQAAHDTRRTARQMALTARHPPRGRKFNWTCKRPAVFLGRRVLFMHFFRRYIILAGYILSLAKCCGRLCLDANRHLKPLPQKWLSA